MDSDDREREEWTLDPALCQRVAPLLCRNRHGRVNRKATRRMVRYGLHLVNSLSYASPGATNAESFIVHHTRLTATILPDPNRRQPQSPAIYNVNPVYFAR